MENLIRRVRYACVVGCIILVASPGLGGTELEFTTAVSPFTPGVNNRGWWSPEKPNVDDNDNYGIGRDSGGVFHNAFFTFDLSELPSSARVLRARLEVQRWAPFWPVSEIGIFHVATDPVTLNYNVGTSQAIFEDLGTGVSYGTFEFRADAGGYRDFEIFELNAAALSDMEEKRGGFFSLGLTKLDARGFLFGGSSQAPPTRLLVEVEFDGDGDGIPDGEDLCAGSAQGVVVDDFGCSVAQLCDCRDVDTPHGAHVRCTVEAVQAFVAQGLLTRAEGGGAIAVAVRSRCGS